MRRLAVRVAVPGLLVACGTTRTVVHTVTVTRTTTVPSADQRIFGHIRAITRSPGGYEVRFDPAWFLTGVTANAAAAEDQGLKCEPTACPGVPDDNLVVDESSRVYVYLLPAEARGTVLTTSSSGFQPTTVTGSQLARIVGGTSALQLFEPLESGVWLTVHIDTVRSFAQQYMP